MLGMQTSNVEFQDPNVELPHHIVSMEEMSFKHENMPS
jgi:hypothetical protein